MGLKKNDDSDVFSDKDPSKPSSMCSIECNPEHSQPPSGTLSPATTIRNRSICPGSKGDEPKESGFASSIDSEGDLTNITSTSFKQRRNHINSKENNNAFEIRDSTQGQTGSFPAACSVREENNEEPAKTRAANDGPAGYSADSMVKLDCPSSNLFQSIARLGINSIGFPINFFIRFISYPMWFLFKYFMFYIDPFRKFRAGKIVISWILSKVWDRISPSLYRWLEERKIIRKVALYCGRGFLWLICVCCILLGLLISSLVISGFMMKYSAEEPITKIEVLNFDYTKRSPVAYVPLISCSGVGAGSGSRWEKNIADNKRTGERFVPTKREVQVMVSLLVPESEYNKDLGVFQIGVDFLSVDGKTISSLSIPYMLRFRSGPIRQILSFLKIVPLMTGYSTETQTLNVKMKDFIERHEPTSCVKVTLERRAEVQHGSGIPELYDAHLVLESKLPFFKRITWHWKKTVFLWITMMTFMIESLFLLVCCRSRIIPIKRQGGCSGCITDKQS